MKNLSCANLLQDLNDATDFQQAGAQSSGLI
jgi:hypothetical protein